VKAKLFLLLALLFTRVNADRVDFTNGGTVVLKGVIQAISFDAGETWEVLTEPSTVAPNGGFTANFVTLSGHNGQPFQLKAYLMASEAVKVGNSYVGSAETTEILLDMAYGTWNASGANTDIHGNYTAGGFYPTPTPDTEKTLWTIDATGALETDTFREGIDKVVYSLADIKAAVKAGPDGGSGGGSTANSEYMFGVAKIINDDPVGYKTSQEGSAFATYLKAAGEASAGQITDALNVSALSHTIEGNSPRIISTATGSQDGMMITAHFLDGHRNAQPVEFDFNPAHNAKIDGMVTFVKAMIAWGLVIVFEWFVWTEFSKIYTTMTTFMPAKGNTVAGSGGQATSLIVAIGVTAVLVTVPVAYWAAADSGMTWATGLANANPMDGGGLTNAVNMGIYLAKYAFPVGTCLAATANAFYIRRFGLITIIFVNRVIAYLVF